MLSISPKTQGVFVCNYCGIEVGFINKVGMCWGSASGW